MSIGKYRYTEKNSFKIKETKTNDKGEFASREEAVEEFVENLKEINLLQQRLYAERKEGVIFVFQAMDAAGKDGCIRTVFGTLTPHGVNEFCFKAPSAEELSHDYLWRFWKALPARGNISIFNRSYYEDVLVGKVHRLYENQIWPDRMKDGDVIEKRYKEINDFEKYLYNNATRVVKIFLNVSKKEQAKRFISRIDTPRKNWKVSENDIKEREYWDDYQEAFESMINNTSSKKSPWYVVPADHKWYARLIVSRIILETLREMNPQFPVIEDDFSETMSKYRETLLASLPKKKDKKEKTEENNCEEVEKETSVEETENFDIEEVVEGSLESEEAEEKKDKKKHKKHKKSKKKDKKKEKKKEVREEKEEVDDDTDSDIDASVENAFFDTSSVVTDAYIEEEEKKIEDKKEQKDKEEKNECTCCNGNVCECNDENCTCCDNKTEDETTCPSSPHNSSEVENEENQDKVDSTKDANENETVEEPSV